MNERARTCKRFPKEADRDFRLPGPSSTATRALLAAAAQTCRPRCGQGRALLGEDHRQEPGGLRLARILGNLVRCAGLFVKHLAGRVRSLLALPGAPGDDGA